MADWNGRALVDTEWLAAHLGADDVRIVDSSIIMSKNDAGMLMLAAFIGMTLFAGFCIVAGKWWGQRRLEKAADSLDPEPPENV